MPLVSALGKERQLSLPESEVILVYIVSSPTVKVVTQRKEKPCLEGTHTHTNKHTHKKNKQTTMMLLIFKTSH